MISCEKKQEAVLSLPIAGNTIRIVNGAIVDTIGNPLFLRGCGLGNAVWSNVEIPGIDHDPSDYAVIKSMNMNVIRFYINYRTFEDDNAPYKYKESGFKWIDANILEAKKNGIYLVLNMHVPQGGFQSIGGGGALWTNSENQNRLTSLWKAIAARYAKSSVIAGYGLVNEPSPTTSISQWQQLAQKITSTIREVDANHLLFIERALKVGDSYSNNSDMNFVKVDDPKVVYEFHLYDPYHYTSQNWNGNPDGGSYPDESKIIIPGDGNWLNGCPANPTASSGTTDWNYFQSGKFKNSDTRIKYALPTLAGASIGDGTIYYDSIWVNEFDMSGNFSKKTPVTLTDASKWYYWSSDGTGSGNMSLDGINGTKCLTITGSRNYATLSGSDFAIVPQNGFSYQICGFMKGKNLPVNSTAKIDIGFFTSANPVYPVNKTYLSINMKAYSDWASANNAPVFLGEFGLTGSCFTGRKGGTQWVSDMIDGTRQLNIHFSYHVYREDDITGFGIFYGKTPTQLANTQANLVSVFRSKLR